MIKYQNMSYKKYSSTALAGGAAFMIFYLVSYHYIGLDELVIVMIAVYIGGVILANGNLRFMILNCWAGYCIMMILSILYNHLV